MHYVVTPQRLHSALKARDKGMYPEGPNPDVPWILVVAKYLSESSNWLDIGCKSGFYAGEVLRQAKDHPNLTITDPDKEMLEFAERFLKDEFKIEVQAVPYDRLPDLPCDSCDLITCRNENPDVESIKRLLAPEGVYIQFFPVRNLKWNDRLDFIISRDRWLEETAEKLGLKPVEAKGWGSKWSTTLDSYTAYLEATEERAVTDSERFELLARFGVGAGICVEEFGMYGVFTPPPVSPT